MFNLRVRQLLKNIFLYYEQNYILIIYNIIYKEKKLKLIYTM